MNDTLTLEVESSPPAKDQGLSIRNPQHTSHRLVASLRKEMRNKMKNRQPFSSIPLKLTMHYKRKKGRADALNIINGVADILQKRSYAKYKCDVWVFDDDAQIKCFKYTEERGTKDEYRITMEAI